MSPKSDECAKKGWLRPTWGCCDRIGCRGKAIVNTFATCHGQGLMLALSTR
jgi:hypothetical protein